MRVCVLVCDVGRQMLCWRANRPQGSQLTDYINMLNLGLVQPVGMQLYYMMIDDPNSVQMIGPFNGTSFAPSFLPVRERFHLELTF